MHRISRVTASIVFLSVLVIMGTSPRAQDAALAQLPLLTSGSLSYLGSFAVPPSDGSGTARGDLTYGGQALSVTPHGTLLLGGHTWYSSLCELSIPGIGGTAAVLQRCVEITEGRLDQVDPGGIEIEYGGSLVYGDRLILSAYSSYDADGNQARSHFVSGTTLAATGDVVGPVQVGAAGAGFVSGYMGLIPPEWQTTLGGAALTGNCCISIISRTSSGPAVSVFNPDDVGAVDPVPATQVIGYPLAQPLANATTQNTLFARSDRMGGVAFPIGTRSVLFIGTHGTGTPCYGDGAACGDPANAYKGDHAYPYIHQVWAYDANELVAVKNGLKRPSDVRPYATWRLDEMNDTGSATITSAFYEPATSRIYVTAGYGSQPRVHVYQVSGGGTVTPPATTPPVTTPPVTTPPTTPPPTTTPPATTPPATTPTVSIPGAPTDLSARVRGTTVTLSWTAPASGGAVTGYVLEQGGSSQATATSTPLDAAQTSTRVSSLSRDRYYFRVRATNAAGTGHPSNEVSVRITRIGRSR